MKIHVNQALCENLAECVFAAPELFKMSDQGELIWTAEADEADRPTAVLAASSCPMNAIRVL